MSRADRREHAAIRAMNRWHDHASSAESLYWWRVYAHILIYFPWSPEARHEARQMLKTASTLERERLIGLRQAQRHRQRYEAWLRNEDESLREAIQLASAECPPPPKAPAAWRPARPSPSLERPYR